MKPKPFYCKRCGRDMSHQKKRVKAKTALILTFCTVGIFLPFWLFGGRWVCMECGNVKR